MYGTVKFWRWRRNPLRRRSDAVEAWTGLALGVVMLVGAPLTGVAAADGMHAALERQSQGRHRAAAVLVDDAPLHAARHNGIDLPQVKATVKWPGPDGAQHRGSVVVHPGARAGSTVPVWLDGRGHLTEAPLGGGQSSAQSDIVGAGAATAFCMAGLSTRRLVRAGLDHHRAAEWEREWALVGPRWTGGRRR